METNNFKWKECVDIVATSGIYTCVGHIESEDSVQIYQVDYVRSFLKYKSLWVLP